jgi:hypothetical protein
LGIRETLNCSGNTKDSKKILLITFIGTSLVMVITTSAHSNLIIPSSALVVKAKGNSSGGKVGGAVPLIPLNSGNPKLDQQTNLFFKCIKKTGHTGGVKGEPSREEVDNCYNEVFVRGDFSGSRTTYNSNPKNKP